MPRVATLLFALACIAAGPVNTEGELGIAGHDPVAYFADGKATLGRADLAVAHVGVTYRFASAGNRDAFLTDPAGYLPQYGGYCAYGLARGYKAVVDPTAFTVAGGKLYLNYNAEIQATWRRDQSSDIARADRNWPTVLHQTELAR